MRGARSLDGRRCGRGSRLAAAAGPAVVAGAALVAHAWLAAAAVLAGVLVARLRRDLDTDAVVAAGFCTAALTPAWRVWALAPGLVLFVGWLVALGWIFAPPGRLRVVCGGLAATWLAGTAVAWEQPERIVAVQLAWAAAVGVLALLLACVRASRPAPSPPPIGVPPYAPRPLPADRMPAGPVLDAGPELDAGAAGGAGRPDAVPRWDLSDLVALRRYTLEHLPPGWTEAVLAEPATDLPPDLAAVGPGTPVRWRHPTPVGADAVAVGPVCDSATEEPALWVTSPYNWAWHKQSGLPVPVVRWSVGDAVVPPAPAARR